MNTDIQTILAEIRHRRLRQLLQAAQQAGRRVWDEGDVESNVAPLQNCTPTQNQSNTESCNTARHAADRISR